MQAPKFWYQSIGMRACALWPLGQLYAWATAKRVKNMTKTPPIVPTICIGNINVGGTGKTPTTIALAQHFSQRGIAVHIVSRGYGANITTTFAVDPRFIDIRHVPNNWSFHFFCTNTHFVILPIYSHCRFISK